MKSIFLYSSLWVSFCAGALCVGVFLRAGIPLDSGYIFFIGAAVYTMYTLDRLLSFYSPEDRINRPGQENWQNRPGVRPLLLLTSVLAAFYCLYTLWNLPLGALLIMACPALISFLYMLPVKPGPAGRLRKLRLGLSKPLWPALVWVTGIALVPLYLRPIPPAWDEYLLIADVFILLFLNAIFFDLLDIRGDRRYHKRTIAVALGRERTIWLLYTGCTLWTLFIIARGLFSLPVRGDAFLEALPFFILMVLVWLFPEIYSRKNLRVWYGHMIDGILILPAISVLLFSDYSIGL